MSDREIDDLADALAAADRAGLRVASRDVRVPAGVSQAMAVQAATLRRLGRDVAGWKIAIGPAGAAVAAPVVDLLDGSDGLAVFHGFGRCHGIEVEIGLVLRDALPPRPARPYTVEEVRDSIASAHLGIEILRHRLREENEAPFPLFLADRLGNGGYILGPRIELQTAVALLASDRIRRSPGLRIWRDGALIHNSTAIHPNGDPLTPLLAYANAPNDELGGLRAGQLVTTGSLCGVLLLREGCCLRIDWLVTLELEIRDSEA